MFSITKVGNEVNSRHIRSFSADEESDIAKLPCTNKRGTQGEDPDDPVNDCVLAGSTCTLVTEDGVMSVYYLRNNDVWTKLK